MAVETLNEELNVVQGRMLRYAEATKLDSARFCCGTTAGMGGGEKRPDDKATIFAIDVEKGSDAYFLVDSPAHFKRGRREVGRTALFHTAVPNEPERLFSDIDTAETFEVTSLIIDDTCAFPLMAIHQASIPRRGYTRSGEIVDYFYDMGEPSYEMPDCHIPKYDELDWELATAQALREAEGRIINALEYSRTMYPAANIYDYV